MIEVAGMTSCAQRVIDGNTTHLIMHTYEILFDNTGNTHIIIRDCDTQQRTHIQLPFYERDIDRIYELAMAVIKSGIYND